MQVWDYSNCGIKPSVEERHFLQSTNGMSFGRYFGGIKLGTGGLVRAYGKVTTECLKDARTITIKPKVLFPPLKMQVWNSCKHFQTLFQSRMCVMLSDFLVAE